MIGSAHSQCNVANLGSREVFLNWLLTLEVLVATLLRSSASPPPALSLTRGTMQCRPVSRAIIQCVHGTRHSVHCSHLL